MGDRIKNTGAFLGGISLVFGGALLCLLIAYALDIRNDRRKVVVIRTDTPLFASADCFPQISRASATIHPGDQVSVRDVSNEKECQIVHVRLKSGQEGYLASGVGDWELRNR
ncbi:MAG TPA: hypothetical protein VMS96_14445 [Terriglobales bacterium]|nr:hypothetical protein [Terriglobales bacterium]